MLLFGTRTSPYVRKVRVVAKEIEIDDRMGYSEVAFSDPPLALIEANPTRRVPTLVADELVLFDSPVIAEWLDATFGNNQLVPVGGRERWIILRTQALVDGLLDSATLVRHETQRPEYEQSPSWIEKHKGKVVGALEWLEQDGAWRLRDEPDLGSISVACALGYLTLRFPELVSASQYPALIRWFDELSKRPSMIATSPN